MGKLQRLAPDNLDAEAMGWPARRVAGVDEVGRGPLAGPVVAAAVILPADLPPAIADRLADSKTLSPATRAAIAADLTAMAVTAIAAVSVADIDRLNILQASLLAMTRAIDALRPTAEGVLVDGNRTPRGLTVPCRTLVKGDGRSRAVAAASIVAKVHRDRLMADLDARYPGYGWASNAGYGTADHRAAILRLGVTPEHRRSFRPVAEQLALNL